MTTYHSSLPLYLDADNCEHPEPPEPDVDDDSTAWDEWHDDHPNSSGPDGEPICMLTELAERWCPACTAEAREHEDLPGHEYVECRIPSDSQPRALAMRARPAGDRLNDRMTRQIEQGAWCESCGGPVGDSQARDTEGLPLCVNCTSASAAVTET